MLNIEEIFNQRTCYNFANKPVSKELLVKIHDLAKLGPTSANSCPLRIVFVQSPEEKAKLLNLVMEFNKAKINSAPVTALFAYDEEFYKQMDKLNPAQPAMQQYFANDKQTAISSAQRNSTLQAAYFMIAARSFGLDIGAMSGFDMEALNNVFFAGTSYKINFICNFGYKDANTAYPRQPRFAFDECCKII